jgi:ATP synthase F1 gamma subunit
VKLIVFIWSATSFVNTMTQQPEVAQLLPLEASADKELKHHWDYIYEPKAEPLLDGLLVRYIETQVYQAVVENIACEQAARMIAMKNATENAGDLIEELALSTTRRVRPRLRRSCRKSSVVLQRYKRIVASAHNDY